MRQQTRVLIVDDQPDAASTLALLLSMNGFTTESVEDSRRAVSVAKAFSPHVAVLDLRMPHIDGLELARLLRAQAGLERVVLIALTAYDDADMRERTSRGGFARHLRKPVSDRDLGELIGELTAADS